jgi:hypothetical protein
MYIHPFLTSGIEEVEWSVSRLCRLIPMKNTRDPLKRKKYGPGAGLGVLEKRKISWPSRD